jgi:hypothetical protein
MGARDKARQAMGPGAGMSTSEALASLLQGVAVDPNRSKPEGVAGYQPSNCTERSLRRVAVSSNWRGWQDSSLQIALRGFSTG